MKFKLNNIVYADDVKDDVKHKKKTCPIPDHHKRMKESKGVCPVPHGNNNNNNKSEPSDGPDRELHPFVISAHLKSMQNKSNDPNDDTPLSKIPSTGRGNSEDGKYWENPSANQLYRSLKRKNKGIDHNDAASVAHIHEAVTSQTWDQIMEYEADYGVSSKCKVNDIKLARFQGMYGIDSYKAKFMGFFFGLKPYDRHDWTIDRCGQEVKYIIDYYAIPVDDANDVQEDVNHTHNIKGDKEHIETTQETTTSIQQKKPQELMYTIDARPAPTFMGMVNRMRKAFQRYRNDESFW